MPITYTNTRPTSAQATHLMSRINALQANVVGGYWRESFTLVTDDQYIGGKITCDRDGNIYVESNNGSVSGVSRRISKYQYDGTIVDEDFILYGSGATGDDTIAELVSMDADENFLWCVNRISATSTSLKKFSLADGSELNEVTTTATVTSPTQSQYTDVALFSDGSICCIYRERGTSPEYKETLFKYNADGTNETEIYSESGSRVGFESSAFDSICVNDNNHVILTIDTASGGSNPIAYRYDSTGTLVDTITNGSGIKDGFTRAKHCFSGNLVIPRDDSIYLNQHLYDQDGTFVTDVDLKPYSLDCTEDENKNLYFSTRSSIFSNAIFRVWKKTYLGGTGAIDQTEFFRYPDPGALTNAESLGTPDGGVAVPATDALQYLTSGKRHSPHHGMLADMREAIETLAPYFLNSATSNAFNVDQEDADNIFNVAIESGQYDWTTPGEVAKQMMRATDFSDMDLVLTELEGASLA